MDLTRLKISINEEDLIESENSNFHYYIIFKDSKTLNTMIETKVVIAFHNEWIKKNIDKFMKMMKEMKEGM